MSMKGAYAGAITYVRFVAGEALVRGTWVYLKSDGLVYMIDDTSKPPLGVVCDTTLISADAQIACPFPILLCRCGGTVTIGSLVQITTDGEIIDGTSDNVWAIGPALQTGSDHAEISVVGNCFVANDISALDGD
jgi:hypothetical protein